MLKRLVLSLLVAAGLMASSASADSYPRPFTYGGMRSNGWPLIKYVNPANAPYPPVDSALDNNAIAAIARYPLIVLDMTPVIPWRQDILTAIKTKNPKTKIIAYVLANHWYAGPTADSTVDLLNKINSAIRVNNGFLYGTDNLPWIDNYTVNWARRPVVEAMVNIWKNDVLSNTAISGIFLDCFSSGGISWTSPYFSRVLNYSLAGYASAAQFDSAWVVNSTWAVNELKAAYPSKIIILNVGRYIQPSEINLMGRMWENFPYLELGGNYGGSIQAKWDTVLTHYKYENAKYSVFKAELSQFGGTLNRSSVYGQTAMQKARYLLGSAALGSGWATFGNERSLPYTPPAYPTWWYDEYSVRVRPNNTACPADTTGKYTGWLGAPRGAASKITGGTGNGAWVRIFDNGRVVVNPKSDTLTYKSTVVLKKITGVMDPTFNNGQRGTAFFIPAYSAVFLINTTGQLSATAHRFLDTLFGVIK